MEDRRLMYVAMTRARNLLAVSAFRWKSTAKTPQPVQPFWMELLWTLAEAYRRHAEDTVEFPWTAPQLVGMGLVFVVADPSDDGKKKPIDNVTPWVEFIADTGYRLKEPVTLAQGTVLTPEGLPDPDEAGEVPYAWALAEAIIPSLMREVQLSPLPMRMRTVRENCERLDLPAPEWLDELAAEEAERASQPPRPGYSPVMAAALPVVAGGCFSAQTYETINPHLGAVLTAMWPFDPLERPVIWRWRSEEDLNEGTEAILRHGRHEELNREIAINSTSRREAVERAALAVENAVAELEAQLAAGADFAAPEPAGAVPEALRRRAQDWEREADLLMRLAEHTEPVLAEQLPGHLSASTFIRLSEDPQGTVHELLRPVPQRPSRAATIGTEVHALIEEHFGVVPSADPLEAPEAEDTLGVTLPGAVEPAGETAPQEVAGEEHLEFAEDSPQDVLFDELSLAEESEQDSSVRSLWERFAASEWGSPGWKERIWAVEYPVETHVEGVSLRGRIDAVFRTEDGDGERWILVDWKTGRRPKATDMQARRFQLGLYRIAFSRIMGIDPERISTVFVYLGGKRVEEVWDEQIRGGLPSEAQLAAVIRKARAGEG